MRSPTPWLIPAVCIGWALGPAASRAESPASPAGFWHVGIVVDDLERMDAFYTRIIGLEQVTHLWVEDPARVEPARADAMRVPHVDELMGIEGTRLEIHHYSDPAHAQFLELLRFVNHPGQQVERTPYSPHGLTHVGLTVDSIDRVLTAIEQHDLGTVVAPPQVLEAFGARLVFVRDPEGTLLELREPLPAPLAADPAND